MDFRKGMGQPWSLAIRFSMSMGSFQERLYYDLTHLSNIWDYKHVSLQADYPVLFPMAVIDAIIYMDAL